MSEEQEVASPASSSLSASCSSNPPAPLPLNPLAEIPDHEIYLLIVNYLMSGPCALSGHVLRRELERKRLLPKRTDFKGQAHDQTFDEVNSAYEHIGNDHLKRLCSLMPQLVDRIHTPSVSGIFSLLGSGRQSVLRCSEATEPEPNQSQVQRCLAFRGTTPNGLRKKAPNFVHYSCGREYTGRIGLNSLTTGMYSGLQRHARHMGHLAPIYCVMFDRSGQHILTGADDSLVKIWSSKDGRLLSTLRGHSLEIIDFSINLENTFLATASKDCHIRTWNLKTTAPIAVLTGQQAQITSVKFCPLVLNDEGDRYLISTGNDGFVLFWKWNIKNGTFEPKPIKFNEKPRAGCHILCSSFSNGGNFLAVGSTDQYVRVYHVGAPYGPVKILEIEAHSAAVDSLQFSNKSLRFLSASKDGTAQVWYYERQVWHNMPLKPDRPPNNSEAERVDPKVVRVNMVGWNCDDTFALATTSDHCFRVWDSRTGKLIHTLKEHKNDVFVVEAHPFDPRIVMTAGHDGHLFIWDIVQGVIMKRFANPYQGSDSGAFFDAKWSPDGQMITASDSHGHMSIFGFGESERYGRVPEQVFFHTDYRPLVRDSNHHVIDEQTQCPPHQMPPPFLVDIDGNPHPTHYQRLVPGRENSNDDQLVPYIAVHERGINEILQPVNSEEIAPVPQANPTIDDMIRQLENERLQSGLLANNSNNNNNASLNHVPQDHRYAMENNAAAGNRNPGAGRQRRNSNHPNPVEGVRQPGANWRSCDASLAKFWMRRTVVKPLSTQEIEMSYVRVRQAAASEEEFFERERKKRPVVTEPQEKQIVNVKGIMTRRKMRINQQRSGVRVINNNTNNNNNNNRVRNAAAARTRRITRRHAIGFVDLENVEELSDSSNDHMSGAESWSKSESSSESLSSDDASSDEDVVYHSSRPQRRRQLPARRREIASPVPNPRPRPKRSSSRSNSSSMSLRKKPKFTARRIISSPDLSEPGPSGIGSSSNEQAMSSRTRSNGPDSATEIENNDSDATEIDSSATDMECV